MSARVSIRTNGHQTLAIKAATGRDELTRLTREAGTLDTLHHKGVVAFVRFDASDGQAEMSTIFVSDRDLQADPPKDLHTAMSIMAAVSATVADLHAMHIGHGRITPDHVLLTPDNRPILCGFADAGPLGPPTRDDPDRDATGAGVRTAAEDVRALGLILTQLVSTTDSPRKERRARRGLDQLIEAATDPDPRRRISAAQLAAATGKLVEALEPPEHAAKTIKVNPTLADMAEERFGPDTKSSDDAARDQADLRFDAFWEELPPEPEPAFPSRPLIIGGVIIGIVALIATLSLLDDSEPTPPVAGPSSTTDAPTTSRPAAVSPPTAGLTATTEPAVSSTARVEPLPGEAPIVELDGVRYRVGTAGDVATVGDWDCDGIPTAALLRPSTGAVFVFDTTDDNLTELPRTSIDDATAIRTEPTPEGDCDLIAIDTLNGTRRFRLDQ